MTEADGRLPLDVIDANDVAQIATDSRRDIALLYATAETLTGAGTGWAAARPLGAVGSSLRFAATDAHGGVSANQHAPACVCCSPQREATRVLLALIQDRARGRCGFFRRIVVAAPNGAVETVADALRAESALSTLFAIRAESRP
ncbi:hypothetical protein [Acetobacter nitrogenifigens]|uniref:Uncharacterized protein n=1 Tax=Acetobacter nitrogenifigens DSM 23921 = NBRC 105050 TaxID=1120919 RepID=A0A511XE33_9PROT|nr:hypothetical protein [Acetobacter nitrogenifigens]GEN61161.1 hypothetical protein ANI02nite_30450 [Acetobacter nitrogenifigens DSM 23921 = NBRC 105050]